MDWNKIYEGKDLAEALRAASRGSGIAEPDLDYSIVEQGRRGLFGLGARNVRIKVKKPLGAVDSDKPAKSPAEERRGPRREPRQGSERKRQDSPRRRRGSGRKGQGG